MRRHRAETGRVRSSSSTLMPSHCARRRRPAAVRWNLPVRGMRSVAWGTGAASPASSSLRTPLYTAPFDQPETAASSIRSRKGISARRRSSSPSHPVSFIGHAPRPPRDPRRLRRLVPRPPHPYRRLRLAGPAWSAAFSAHGPGGRRSPPPSPMRPRPP